MENIFDIKFTYEQFVKDNVILKFSNKQGGDYNVFSSYWQCFAWAAVIGFLRDERKPLSSPLADRPFSLRTMQNNEGEKVAQALICMCIAKNDSLQIMNNPTEAINMINEYANAGFYYVHKQISTGESTFNDLQQVMKEIFGRGAKIEKNIDDNEDHKSLEALEESQIVSVVEDVKPVVSKRVARWKTTEIKDLLAYYKGGMTIEQLSATFDKPKESVIECLIKQGIYEQRH